MQGAQQHKAQVINPTGLLPGGIDSFARVMQGKYCWVDKSLLIQDALTCSKNVMLITRPRRFGKTINLSLLRYFFDNAPLQSPFEELDLEGCFRHLLIGQFAEMMQHRGKYPVIHMSFKDVKKPTWEASFEALQDIIYKEIDRHEELKNCDLDGFGDNDRLKWKRILNHEGRNSDWENCLVLMCQLLTLYHKRPAWIFLDEYDRPIHQAYVVSKKHNEDLNDDDSYYGKMISFMRDFLGKALKSNDFLFRCVITGILRVAKEDIFSAVNNLGVYGVLDDPFAQHFGFTQAEIDLLLQKRDLQHRSELIKQSYNGYCFGEDRPVTLYNPWSVISYAGNPTNILKEYWVNSGGIDILQSLGLKRRPQDRETMETLLSGNNIRQDVSDSMPLRDLDSFPEALYSLLLTSGYVTASNLSRGTIGRMADLRIPNQEVHTAFRRLVATWFKHVPTNALLTALRQGKPEEFARQLDLFARASLSYFDIQPHEPEWVYHMLLLGILSHVVDDYRVRSNRESGDGRCDICMIPGDFNLPGVIMEFKQASTQEDLKKAAQAALEQIQTKDYSAEFVDHPPKGILQLGIGFCGKHTQVKHHVCL